MNKLPLSLRSIPPGVAILAAVLAGVCGWAYWTTFEAMARRWVNDPQYSHGYLVPAFAVVLLWLRRDRLQGATPSLSWAGLLLVAVGCGVRVLGAYRNIDWLDAASLVPTLAGFFLIVGGRKALMWAWPSLAFLLFMIPLPFRVETALAHPLQGLATISSTYVLQLIGVPALAEGNVILLSNGKIGVVEACSGLSMLLIFFALSTAVAILIKRPWPDKIVLVLSAIPIAIVANVARIVTTGVAQELVGPELARKIFHDWAGWMMMPLALALMWVEIKLLDWLLVDATPAPPPSYGQTIRPAAASPTSPSPAPTPPAKKDAGRRQRKGGWPVLPPGGRRP